MQRGSVVHAALEHRLLKGSWEGVADVISRYNLPAAKVTPESVLQIAVANEGEFPQTPVAKRHVESSFRLDKSVTGAAWNIVGVIDWIEATHNRISDHKTLSSDNYKLTLTELERHPQAVIYGHAARTIYDMDPPVRFRHIYYPTTGRARPATSEIVYTADALDDAFGKIVDYSHVIADTAKAKEAAEAKPNWGACGDYGGCPFTAYCQLVGDEPSITNALFDIKTETKKENKMSLKDRIKSGKNSPKKKATKALGVNPPETPKTEAPKTPTVDHVEQVLVLEEGVQTASADIAANWTAHAADHGLNPHANPLQTVTMGDAIKGSEKKFEPIHRILLINCVPRKMETVYFDKWIQPYVEEVLQAHHATHYMLPPLDYGKGKAEIALAVKKEMSRGHKTPTVMCVDRKHPLADVIIAEIIGSYDEVIERI